MGVQFYAPGKHPAGFVGFRVSRSFDGRNRQKYFSTSGYKPDDIEFKLKEIQAEALDTAWRLESMESQRTKFLNSDHPNTKPGRGVGVHGLTKTFFKDKKENWIACFSVENRQGVKERITFSKLRYSEAWEEAVSRWARYHTVSDEHKERLIREMPDPGQFKELRKIMKEEGHDIPSEALGPIFRESRERLKALRTPVTSIPGAKSPDRELVDEVKQWFEKFK